MRNFGLDEEQADEWLSELKDEQPEMSFNSFEGNSGPEGDGAD